MRRGGERLLHEFSRSMAARGHDVTVFSSGAQGGTSMHDGVRIVRQTRRFAPPERHEPSFGRWLLRRLWAEGFDAVHSLGPRDAVASIRASRLRRGGHRTVYTNLGSPVKAWWDLQPNRRAHERVVRDVDVYGCLSRYALAALEKDYGRGGVLTPGGVSLDEFHPASAREPMPTVLYSGALDEPRKGVAALLEAVALLLPTEPRLKLWLSGSGDAAPMVQGAPSAVQAAVEILPLGDPHGVAERYGRAWVTALPAKGEAFGLVLLESLACGTPVVASRDSALPELVAPGRTGALCDPDSPADVAAAISAALQLSRAADIVAACREAARPFDWTEAVAPILEALYGDDEAR